MRPAVGLARALAIAAVAVALLALSSSAGAAYEVRGVWATVYRDGVVRVRLVASVGEVEPLVTVPLLSDGAARVYNVLVVDEAGEALYYEVVGWNLTVYALGASSVTVEYETDALTRKEGPLWTLSFASPFDLELSLPEGSVILYVSSAPNSVRAEDGRLVLSLAKGRWEVSYEVPPTAPPAPPPSPPTAPPAQPPSALPVEYLLAACAGAAVAAAASVARRRRARAASREEEVVSFLRRRGGRALEAELREAFPHIPKTTMWRLLRRLEKEGRVRIRKVGLQNLVELA